MAPTIQLIRVMRCCAHEKFTNAGGVDTVPVQLLRGVQCKFRNSPWIFQDANFSIPKDNLNFKMVHFYERWQEKEMRYCEIYLKSHEHIRAANQRPHHHVCHNAAALRAQIDFLLFPHFADWADTQSIDSEWKWINSPSKLIPIPKSDVMISEGAKLNTLLWLIHRLLPVLWCSSLRGEITTPAMQGFSLFFSPSSFAATFRESGVLIWHRQESSFHSKHIKESGSESVVHIIQMGKLASYSLGSTSRQRLWLTCRFVAGGIGDEFPVSLTAAIRGKLQCLWKGAKKDETQWRDNCAYFTSCAVLAGEHRPSSTNLRRRPRSPCSVCDVHRVLYGSFT